MWLLSLAVGGGDLKGQVQWHTIALLCFQKLCISLTLFLSLPVVYQQQHSGFSFYLTLSYSKQNVHFPPPVRPVSENTYSFETNIILL